MKEFVLHLQAFYYLKIKCVCKLVYMNMPIKKGKKHHTKCEQFARGIKLAESPPKSGLGHDLGVEAATIHLSLK